MIVQSLSVDMYCTKVQVYAPYNQRVCYDGCRITNELAMLGADSRITNEFVMLGAANELGAV